MNVELCPGFVVSGASRSDDGVKRVPNAERFQGPLQKWVKDRARDDADRYPGLVDFPHGSDRARYRRCSSQGLPHEICDAALHVLVRHVKPHGGKDMFEAGFGSQLVSMIHDLVAELPVAGIGFVEYRGVESPAFSIPPPAKKRGGEMTNL